MSNSAGASPGAVKQQAQACIRSEQYNEALCLLTDLCTTDETDVELRCMLASVYGMLGENAAAERAARAALALNGELAEAWSLLGMALMVQENYPAAADAFQEVVQRNPADARAHMNLGKTGFRQGNYSEAATHFQRAIALHPGFAELHYLYARALHEGGEREPAAESYETAIRLQPGLANAHAWLASLHQQAGNVAAAFAQYEMALAINPDSAEINYNHATLLQAEARYAAAEAAYRKVLALNAGLIEAWNNLGLTLQEQGRFDAAMHCFDHVVGMSPADVVQANTTLAEVRWHRALLYLLTGDFARGWPEYEWRRADPAAVVRQFPQPCWDGSPLAGRTILVHTEQGIGDEIMFASCIPDLVGRAEHVFLECEPRLVPLFTRSFPGATVIHGQQADDVPLADVQLATGSLPRYLRSSLENFPAADSYLVADAAALGKWKQRYKLLGEGRKVGISWRGGRVSQSRKRSTSLDSWEGLLRLESVHWVNLQYGDCSSAIQQLQRDCGVRIHDWEDADPLSDMDDFAAQVAALDLVISVDNATVHMAAALGVPVWILQPFAPEWRWLAAGEGSYWYPSVRQFRQSTPSDWQPVFRQITVALKKLLTE